MMAPMVESVKAPTRDRLLAAGMDLFARQGFKATTVGEIEEAAGLVPRRGALYKHFASKQALLEAGLEVHLVAVDQVIDLLGEGPSADPVDEVRAIGAWLLAELAAEEQLTLILEKEGDRLPEFRDRFRDRISDAGYRAAGSGDPALGARRGTRRCRPERGRRRCARRRRHRRPHQLPPVGLDLPLGPDRRRCRTGPRRLGRRLPLDPRRPPPRSTPGVTSVCRGLVRRARRIRRRPGSGCSRPRWRT